jgi:hypothetical protein
MTNEIIDTTVAEDETIPDEAKERLNQCIPVAQEILKIVAAHPELVSDISKSDRTIEYKAITKEIMSVFVEHDINYTDRKFIASIVMGAYESVGSQVINSVEYIYEMANKKLFGKDILDIKMSDLEKIING